MAITTEECAARDARTIDELMTMMGKYHAIVTSDDLNRDHKVGYLLAACMVDERFKLTWMPHELGLRLVDEALTRIEALIAKRRV